MFGYLNQLWWGGDPDAVDPKSGLTKRDIYAVQKSWSRVSENPMNIGMHMFKRLIHENPEAKQLFRMIRNVPEDKIGESNQFKAHVVTFASNVELAVKYLEQPEVVVAMMNKLGESHGRRQIQNKYFHILIPIMLNELVRVLNVDSKTFDSWEKTLKFLIKHIFETLEVDEPR